ncbi:MAG: deoxyribodipyrimidine photo-lyase [Cyclobacteriaceae bacterium]
MVEKEEPMKVAIFWFRRDLRLDDNMALFEALNSELPVQPIFIFDKEILEKLEDDDDARVSFIHKEILRLGKEIQRKGGAFDVRYGDPVQIWIRLLEDYNVGAVYANSDYEPYATVRDKEVSKLLASKGIPFVMTKDHVVFQKDEVVKANGEPYIVYTPYSKLWKAKLSTCDLRACRSESIRNWYSSEVRPITSLERLGFRQTAIRFPDRSLSSEIAKNYDQTRDIPSIQGTSRLSVHLRFGTISIRKLTAFAEKFNSKFLNELIWRDFYQSILWHFPHVVSENFSKKYDGIEWRNNETEFEKWCEGRTGYPIVDAGIRELNTTGFMHNRVRMITASFLTKHLLINWQWGEAYFATKLLDYELASNNGGWQWAAGTGVDAAPYFRIFNPYTQTEKFDPHLRYIKKWVPEVGTTHYPAPIVDHRFARQRALDTYAKGLR